MLKKYRVYIIIFYTLAAAALVCAAFFDLRLDIALNNPENPFAVWMRNSGESAAHLVCPVAGMMIAVCGAKKRTRLVGAAVSLAGSVYFGIYFGKYYFTDDAYRTVYSVIFGLCMGAALLFASRFVRVNKNSKQAIVIASFVAIGVYFAELALIGVVKELWGRVRFRDLLAAGSYDAFTDFWRPNGVTGNRSFPSGHTGNAAMSFMMLLLPAVSKRWKSLTPLCFALPLAWTVAVAYTRLVMGAHYLSDVAVGGAITFTCVIVGIAVYERRERKSISPDKRKTV